MTLSQIVLKGTQNTGRGNNFASRSHLYLIRSNSCHSNLLKSSDCEDVLSLVPKIFSRQYQESFKRFVGFMNSERISEEQPFSPFET